MKRYEYPIWGVPPNSKDETLLYTLAKTHKEAKRVCKVLADEHGCTKCRVQVLDLTATPNFAGVIN